MSSTNNGHITLVGKSVFVFIVLLGLGFFFFFPLFFSPIHFSSECFGHFDHILANFRSSWDFTTNPNLFYHSF